MKTNSKMIKRGLAFGGPALLATIFGVAQQPQSSVDALVARLRSNNGLERTQAFERLRSDAKVLRMPKVKTALLGLLDRENHELDTQLAEAQKIGYPDEGDNEAWAEYHSALIDAVDSFADWNDPRQACILVNAISSDDSAFAAEIADHGRVTIPCLMKKSASAISMNRAAALPVLVRALARAKDRLDPETAQAARQIVLGALGDPDKGVRAFTVNALGKYGAKDMIPALTKVAEEDPAAEVQGDSIRKSAAEAIVAIQKR